MFYLSHLYKINAHRYKTFGDTDVFVIICLVKESLHAR